MTKQKTPEEVEAEVAKELSAVLPGLPPGYAEALGKQVAVAVRIGQRATTSRPAGSYDKNGRVRQ